MTTYYVDATTGDDDDSGLTEELAWQTIGKVNGETFSPGDTILFKRGETWAGTMLTAPSSGAMGSPITFGAYGTGANPIINVAAGTACMYANGKSYIIFDSIDVADAPGYAYRTLNCDHIRVRNADITGVADGGSGVDFNSTVDNGLNHHNTVEGCHIHDFNGWGISGAEYPTHHNQYLDCNIHDIGNSVAPHHHGIYWSNQTDSLIGGCVINNSWCHGIKVVDVTDCTIRKSYITNSGLSGISGAQIGMTAPVTNLRIENCILAFSTVGSGVDVDAGVPTNVTLFHNTIVENYYSINLPDGATGWVIKNNIGYQDRAWLDNNLRVALRINGGDADAANNTFDNNNWFFRNGAGEDDPIRASDLYTLEEWQAVAGDPDPNSISANPVFVTDFTDLHLQSTSPCRNVGEDLGVADDYDGVARDATPDIGAYEYVPTYTLTADQGALSLAGQAAGALASRQLGADSGAISMAGQNAALLASRLLAAAQGTLGLSGQDAGLLASRLLAADSGALTLAGQDVGMLASRLLAADGGAITLAGQDASLLIGRMLTAAQGTVSLSGHDAGLFADRLLTADAGTITLTGQDAGLLVARLLTAESSTLTLAGLAVTFMYTFNVPDSRIFVIGAEGRVYVIAAESRVYAINA